ncbi:MAG: 1-acyl-sn-glycerol-3-phosphate acyltransferase [Planctomycetota bacterium]
MQNIILEEPYEFVPPVESDWWCWLVRLYLPRYLRKVFAIHSTDCRHADRLRASLDEGKSVILAPNHCRLSDPMALGLLSKQAGCELFAMASWHLFKETAFQTFLIRRMGAFSVYREGNDRPSVNQAIDILFEGRRPLIIFPEGAVSRHNDLMMDVMDGPAFIARQAAKRREKAGKPGVVIHPVAIRYKFLGDLEAAVVPELERFEKAFSWQPQTHLSLVDRIAKSAKAMLALKELEYTGASRDGDAHERAERLIVEVITRLEEKWGTTGKEKGLVSRVKAIRAAILPDLIEKKVTPEERESRWRDLAAVYYLQQIAHYPVGYITGGVDLPERVIETVERLHEDFNDRIDYKGPMHCTMMVGDAIEVSTKRERSTGGDPAMAKTKDAIQAMLDELVAERLAELGGAGKTS